MFLSQLNQKERLAFQQLAYYLVSFNGVTEEEAAMLAATDQEMGVASNPSDRSTDLEDLCSRFESGFSQRIALIELLLLAKADGYVCEKETDFASQVTAHFRLPAETVEQAQQWVDVMVKHYMEAVTFLNQEVHVAL